MTMLLNLSCFMCHNVQVLSNVLHLFHHQRN
jgi:hypothetical protein